MTNHIQKTDATELPTDDILELDLAVGSSEPFADNLLDDADDFLALSSADARSSDDILNTYSIGAHDLNHMEEMHTDTLMGEMDDIEAELLALRQQLEAETQEYETDSEHDEPTLTGADDPNDDHTTPQEDSDPFNAFVAELLSGVSDNEDYGVNSQRFKPDEFDVASSTAEIAPVQIDETELETINGSDLEAMFGLNDDCAPNVNSTNGFLAEAAQLEEQDELPTLLPHTEEFMLDDVPPAPESALPHPEVSDDRFDDEPELTAQIDAIFKDMGLDIGDNITLDEDDAPLPETAPLNADIVEDNIVLDDDIVLDVSDDEPLAAAAPPAKARSGLDLGNDDNPMAWLEKMKNEMVDKFDIDIDQEAEKLSQSDFGHLYDDLEVFDANQADLGENLNKLPEFDETKLNQPSVSDDVSVDDIMTFDEEPVVRRPPVSAPLTGKSVAEVLNLNMTQPEPREINTNISLDDIWADHHTVTNKIDLTAAPLDEAELELFDESFLFEGVSRPASNSHIDLELDFSADELSETGSVDLTD